MMTSDEYRKEGGEMCPACRRYEVSYEDMTQDETEIIQKGICHVCDAEWEEVYKLDGYINLVE